MKIKQLVIILLAGASIVSCQTKNDVSINTQEDSVSYILGAYQGQNMIMNFERAKIDSMLDMDLYFKAFKASVNNKKLTMEPDSNAATLELFFQELQTANMLAARDTTGTLEGFNPEKKRIDSVSYLLGADFGKRLITDFKANGLDTILSIPIIADAYVNALKGETPKIDPEANMMMLETFFQNLEEAKLLAEFGANKLAGEEFLAKNKAVAGVTETASGLQYEVIVEGKGPKPQLTDRVKVHYHGTFVTGEVFDSSVERGEPAEFGLTQVIRGWTEALQLMPVGSKFKLYIPYEIAYGKQGRGSIPPFSMLIFEVELIEILK